MIEQWFPIPGYSNYLITKSGKVKNIKLGKLLTGSKNPAGYINIRLTADDGTVLTWGQHRLLGYVFLPFEGDMSQLYINHIDGIKNNNILSNLEWTTPTENVEHAGRMGLTDKCTPISVRNILTQETWDFPSIIACARYFNETKDSISYRVRLGEDRICPNNRQYRRGNSDLPWVEIDNIPRTLSLNSTSKMIIVKNLETNEELVFDKMTRLAYFLHVSLPSLSEWMKLDQPVVPGLFQLKWFHKGEDWRDVENPYKEIEKLTNKRIIEVENVETSECMIYYSMVKCAKEYNLGVTTLNHRLNAKTEKEYSGFKFRYKVNS